MSLALPAQVRSDNMRGIAAMLTAMAVFVINDTLMKIATGYMPVGEAIFLRGVFLTILCGSLLVSSGKLRTLSHAVSPRVMARGLADAGGALFFISALVHMPIGDIFGILQFTPLAITAAAALFLGAQVGWRRWSATCIGLIGVLIIVRPGGAAFNPYALLAIVSVLCAVVRDLLTRGITPAVSSLVIVWSSGMVVTVASLGFLAFEEWFWPAPATVLILLAGSVALLAGQYCLIAAMRMGDIAAVAPFRYSVILWAVLSGYLVWNQLPDLMSWVGIAIVSAAGLYAFLREQRLARMAAA